MSLKIAGSFAPITSGRMKMGNATPPGINIAGLTWEKLTDDGVNDYGIKSWTATTADYTPAIKTSSGHVVDGYYAMISNPISGDFTFSIDFTLPNSQGYITLGVYAADKSELFTPPSSIKGLIEAAAYSAWNGGNPFNRRGYTSYGYVTSTLSAPTTLSIVKSGTSIQGVGEKMSSSTLTYSGDVRVSVYYVKAVYSGNNPPGNDPITLTMSLT